MKAIIHTKLRDRMWAFSAFFMAVAVPSLLVGRAVMFVFLSLGLIVGLLASRNILDTVKTALTSPIAKILVIILVAFFIISINAVNPARSFDIAWQMVYMALSTLGLYVVFSSMPKDKTKFLWRTLHASTLFICALCIIDAFFQISFLGEFLHGNKAGNVHRLNFMSPVLAMLLPFIWVYEMKYEDNLLKRYGFVLLVFWAVFICGGRAGWIAMLASLTVFLFLMWQQQKFKLRWYQPIVAISALALGPVLFGFAKGWAQFQERLNIVPESTGFASGRMGIWQFALDHMNDNPLTGIGLGNFRNLPLPENGLVSNAHPHNFVLQIGLETGLLGSVTVSILLVILTLSLWKSRTNAAGIATGCAVIAFFVSALANTSIFQAWWLILLPFVVTLGITLRKS